MEDAYEAERSRAADNFEPPETIGLTTSNAEDGW